MRVRAAERPAAQLARRGEDLAAEYVTSSGLVVLSRNWWCREGELDLVATDRERLIVVSHRCEQLSTCDNPSTVTPMSWELPASARTASVLLPNVDGPSSA